MGAFAGNFNQDVDITWGDGRGKILNNGELLTLYLDKTSWSGLQSKNNCLESLTCNSSSSLETLHGLCLLIMFRHTVFSSSSLFYVRYGANTPLANLLPAPSLFIPGGSQLEVSSWRVSSHFLCQLHIAARCLLLIITECLMQYCSETGFGPLLRCINALPTQYSINQHDFQSDIGGNFFWVNI